MPRLSHEALVELVRQAPEIIPAMMWPESQARGGTTLRVHPSEFIDLNFAEHRADVVLGLEDPAGELVEALVIEVQLARNPRKHVTWPLYVAGLRTRLNRPTVLVVVAPNRKVARWAATPIDLGRGRCVLHPWVIGPDDIPAITDPVRAREAPELAVLSVAAHADTPDAARIALAAMVATERLDGEQQIFYSDFIIGLLGHAARAALEKLMRMDSDNPIVKFVQRFREKEAARARAKGRAKGRAEGRAEGKAQLLLKLLALRGFVLDDGDRRRVLGCTDDVTLETWAARVLTAQTLADVFADPH